MASLPRLAELPSLTLLHLECAWWPAGTSAEEAAARSLVELCRRAAGLRRIGMPCRKSDEYSVPLVAAEPSRDATAAAAATGYDCDDEDDVPYIYGSTLATSTRVRVGIVVVELARAALAAEGMDPDRVRMGVSNLWP